MEPEPNTLNVVLADVMQYKDLNESPELVDLLSQKLNAICGTVVNEPYTIRIQNFDKQLDLIVKPLAEQDRNATSGIMSARATEADVNAINNIAQNLKIKLRSKVYSKKAKTEIKRSKQAIDDINSVYNSAITTNIVPDITTEELNEHRLPVEKSLPKTFEDQQSYIKSRMIHQIEAVSNEKNREVHLDKSSTDKLFIQFNDPFTRFLKTACGCSSLNLVEAFVEIPKEEVFLRLNTQSKSPDIDYKLYDEFLSYLQQYASTGIEITDRYIKIWTNNQIGIVDIILKLPRNDPLFISCAYLCGEIFGEHIRNRINQQPSAAIVGMAKMYPYTATVRNAKVVSMTHQAKITKRLIDTYLKNGQFRVSHHQQSRRIIGTSY